MPHKALIIGAGYSGLAAAALLAREGWDVTLCEKNSLCGGRAQTYRDSGFLFDMGPSWYLMPEAFERIFARLDTSPQEQFTLKRLSPSYRILTADRNIDILPDLEDNAETFDRLERDGYRKVKSYLARAEEQYKISVDSFLYRSYPNVASMLSPGFLWKGMKLGLWRNVEQLAARTFESDLLRKIMGYTMVFIGGSPDRTPGFYSLMSYIDLRLNVWYPMGGMNVPAAALERIGKTSGARYLYNLPVEKILVEDGRALGVRTAQGDLEADIVISNADYYHTEQHLLDEGQRGYSQSYWRSRTISPSGFIIYLGVSKKLDRLLHHNLYFHGQWHEHFRTIFDQPSWPDRFSYYVCRPSCTDESVAPSGHENLFFLVPVAPGLDDPDDVRERYFNQVLDHFEDLIGEKIRDHIVVKRIFSHRDFASSYNALQGSAFGLAHTLRQTAVFRPAQVSPKVKNLYFTGQYTHPGVGLPMTLISAEVLCDLIQKAHA
jgi:phytoene desaturase